MDHFIWGSCLKTIRESSRAFQLTCLEPDRLDELTPLSDAPTNTFLCDIAFHRFDQRGTAEGNQQTRHHSVPDGTWHAIQGPRAGKTTPDGFLAVLLLSLLVPRDNSQWQHASAWLGAADPGGI